MSFLEQERALFDLLFDRSLRENFCANSTAALSNYTLDEHELDDFKEIRPDAIELDATMRAYLILTQVCRQFPVTFSLVSSLAKGIDLLKGLINRQTMRCHTIERATVYGSQLREHLANFKFDSDIEQTLVGAILEAELGMVWTSATLKRQILAGETPLENTEETSANWLDMPVKLATFVSAAMLPQSYAKLKNTLCVCEETGLWAHLSKTQLSPSLRKKTLAKEEPKLFITRAHVNRVSRCEPVVDHQTIELTEGFAPLFQHINGVNSVAGILSNLQQAGAPPQILQGVEAGFKQLLTFNMLEFA